MVFMTPLARTAIFPATVFTPCLNWAMSGPEGSTLSKPAAPAEDTHTHTHTHTRHTHTHPHGHPNAPPATHPAPPTHPTIVTQMPHQAQDSLAQALSFPV